MTSRRALIAAALGALAARPAVALAADRDPEILLLLVAREDAAALAYREAAPEPLPGIAAEEGDHGKALRTNLDALGRGAPQVELDATARRLAEAPPDERLDAAIALEASLVDDYAVAVGGLTAPGILQSVATILASHAQHHARLRALAGLDPFG
ncbi:MAG TPA: ferritin-like domain-containing protein [Solirubrobacteraceae bacterium]|nr:ferritin-like domain-containing protein [Solirubrobacteraceae bacterium]